MEKIKELPGFDLIHTTYVGIAHKNRGDEYSKKEKFALLSIEEQTLYAIWVLDVNLRSGGFIQYFQNSTDDIFKCATAGFNQLGLERLSILLGRAREIYHKDEKLTSKSRRILTGLKKEYVYFSSEERLYGKIENYIKNNKNLFFPI